MRIWLGGASNWVSFSSQDLPTFPGIGERDRLDHHTFVGPTNAARTRLTSNINPTDVFDNRFLLRGRGWGPIHRTPAFPAFPTLSLSWHHSPASVLLSPGRARNPTNQGERQLMLDRQSSQAVDKRTASDCCNKPYRPLVPWWTGSRLFREVTLQLAEEATSQNFGSPAAFTSISPRGIASWGYTQTII